MKDLLKPLAKGVLIPVWLIAKASATADANIYIYIYIYQKFFFGGWQRW